MDEAIQRIEKLAEISPYIKLYKDFGKTIVLKNMGKITGEIDKPYMDFLYLTNGASILDYCFIGFKNKELGANLYDNNRELWMIDNSLTFQFWGCVADSAGNTFGYVKMKNQSGAHYWGYHSTNELGKIYLVASSFYLFINTFLDQIELTLKKDKNAIGLPGNDWFLNKEELSAKDEELHDFLADKKTSEYKFNTI